MRVRWPTPTPFEDIGFETASFNLVNGAFGIKVNLTQRMLVNFNLLFKLGEVLGCVLVGGRLTNSGLPTRPV